ncbi:MAG: N-acetylmuramoyl-L-alanine amidase [Bacteroidales bacterium]|nr:N-acetylmuramoyl-L-alanine amidase [Bacteroidales bacterium]
MNKYRIYLLLFILSVGCCSFAEAQNNYATRIKTVVIDPGHGGHDPGTVSSGAKYKEKDIVLSVGLKLGNMIKSKYPHIKIIYTRSSDKFVPLAERSDIANRNKADLFISIHVNATKSTSVSGTETFVMGMHKSESNFELCKAENSVIALEDNYETKYEGFNPNSPESYIIFSLLQNTHLEQSIKFAEIIQNNYKKGPVYNNRGVKQGGLIVLWRSTMPAILTEIGFLSNSKDRAAMITKEGQNAIAKRLFNAFCQYKEVYEGNALSEQAPPAAEKTKESDDFYSIQIFSVSKPLKSGAAEFKGAVGAQYIKSNGTYKYMLGSYSSKENASKDLPSVRKKFPGAFIIHVKSGQVIK